MTAKSATLTTLREMNSRSVLEALVQERGLSRAEVARRLGMSKPTANLAITALREAGLVRERPRTEGELHYGAVFFEPTVDVGQVVGIDIGARFIRGAIADLGGTVLARVDEPRTAEGSTTLLADVQRVRDQLASAVPDCPEGVVATVVGVAGVVEPGSGQLRVSSEAGLEGYAIVERLSGVLSGPLEVDNDVNLAALGELWRGAGRGVEDFAFLAVGSGVGAGLVLDGRLRRGHHGAAGEVDFPGHRPFAARSPAADSLRELIADAHRAQERANGTAPPTQALTPEEVFEQAGWGNAFAVKVVQEEAARIAAAIASIALVVDVPLVVIGGGIGLNGSVLLDPVRTRLAQLVPYPPRVQISELGDAASLIGAVCVAARTAWPRVVDARLGVAGQAAAAK
jgi:predicted NBD/HSP70 family sugar kinase